MTALQNRKTANHSKNPNLLSNIFIKVSTQSAEEKKDLKLHKVNMTVSGWGMPN